MSKKQPHLLQGWLGEQPKFNELGMFTFSHTTAEFEVVGDNGVIIVMRTSTPIKVVTKLFNSRKLNNNLEEYMFTQRRDNDQVIFHLGFPENGTYHFWVFALEESNPSENLPNVFNYLIHVNRIHRPAVPIVKAMTKFFDDYCYTEEPLVLTNRTPDLGNVRFRLYVPGAEQVAVNCKDKWFQLARGRDPNEWEGVANLAAFRGGSNKVYVASNYDRSTCFHVLLQYTI